MVSIKDIAERAHVSIGTVDRVLHNRGRVSDETKAKVERIIVKMGYRPNIHARNLSLDRSYTFGILLPRLAQDSEYWKIPVRGIEKAERELRVYKVQLGFHFFDRYSERSFERAFHEALRSNPDGLLIAPVLPAAAQRLMSRIPLGMPYVFIDSMIPGTNCLSFIGQDPYQSGFLAARLMLKSARGGGSVAIIKVTPEDFHIAERICGFLAAMQDDPRMCTTVYEVDSHRGSKAFADAIKRILEQNDDLAGLFISNAWTHAVARLVNARPEGKRVALIGYDLVEKNLRELRENTIDFLISQRPEMQGYEGVYCLYEHVVLREPVKQKIMVPIDILTKDNVQYYQD